MSNRRRPTRLVAVGCGAALAIGPAAGAPAHADLAPIDLKDGFDIRIDGASYWDSSGRAVTGAGDVNGDGLDDLLIGAPDARNNGRDLSGSSYVVFGGGSGLVDLADLGPRGFAIDGAGPFDESGVAVGAADVNGDGLGDLLIGAPGADGPDRVESGATHVVFGGPTGPVDLASPGPRAFRINGGAARDNSGIEVAGAGDVNGDGFEDLLIGAPGADSPDGEDSGAAYVVLGNSEATALDLEALGPRGYRIDGARSVGFALDRALPLHRRPPCRRPCRRPPRHPNRRRRANPRPG